MSHYYIQELIQARILHVDGNGSSGSYRCVCGALVTSSNIYNHIDGRRHRNFTNNNHMCTQHSSDLTRCPNCMFTHCVDCHQNLNRCPVCHEYIHPSREILVNKANRLIHKLRSTLLEIQRMS